MQGWALADLVHGKVVGVGATVKPACAQRVPEHRYGQWISSSSGAQMSSARTQPVLIHEQISDGVFLLWCSRSAGKGMMYI